MLTDIELNEKLNNLPAPRVTEEYLESRIKNKTYIRLPRTIICSLELDNGYSVRGEASCVNLANYDQEIGERISYDNAFNKGHLIQYKTNLERRYGKEYVTTLEEKYNDSRYRGKTMKEWSKREYQTKIDYYKQKILET